MKAIDKFSKFAVTKVLKSRADKDIRQYFKEIFYFLLPETIIFDNEKSFNAVSTNHMLKYEFGFHSTLQEIMRYLKTERAHANFEELLEKSVKEYNMTVHSTTKRKPLEVLFGRRVSSDPEQLEKFRRETMQKIADISYHNKRKAPLREGDVIYVKINKRLGNILTPKYKKEMVASNNNSTV